MSPHRLDFILIGMVTGGWWTQLSPVKKALSALAVVAVVAFSAGSLVSQVVMERTGALRRLDAVEERADRAERIAVRDSVRVEDLAIRQARLDVEFEERLAAMEKKIDAVDDRTKRIACILAGGRGASCL